MIILRRSFGITLKRSQHWVFGEVSTVVGARTWKALRQPHRPSRLHSCCALHGSRFPEPQVDTKSLRAPPATLPTAQDGTAFQRQRETATKWSVRHMLVSPTSLAECLTRRKNIQKSCKVLHLLQEFLYKLCSPNRWEYSLHAYCL